MPEINLLLQKYATPFWDKFFLTVSGISNEYVYVAMVLVIYYFVDKYKGVKIGLIVSSTLMLNFLFKNILKVPRPYVNNKDIVCKDIAQGYGYSFPSGHSQLNSGFFTAIHRLFGKKRFIPLSAAFVLLTAFSRVYLGVHSVWDVTAGLLIGLLWSLVACKYIDVVLKDKKNLLIVFSLVGIIDVILFKNTDSIKMLYLYFGLISGFLIEDKYVGYANASKISVKTLECVFCFIGILLIQFVFKYLPSGVRFIKYFAVGSWLSLAAPFCLTRIKRLIGERFE